MLKQLHDTETDLDPSVRVSTAIDWEEFARQCDLQKVVFDPLPADALAQAIQRARATGGIGTNEVGAGTVTAPAAVEGATTAAISAAGGSMPLEQAGAHPVAAAVAGTVAPDVAAEGDLDVGVSVPQPVSVGSSTRLLASDTDSSNGEDDGENINEEEEDKDANNSNNEDDVGF